jgi:predicted negative regulator of RcsB-dependent stress response
MGKEVTEYMTTQFRKLFIDDQSKDVSPLDLVSIYDEFKELTPIGDEGDIFVQNLAERLVEIDLLGRASDLLQHQLDHRLTGESAVRVGTRLAAIQLLDNKPDRALESLKKTENVLNQTVSTDSAAIAREVRLLKARALSKLNEADKALAILRGMPNDKDVNRLRADIAWNAGQWGQAASAFADLITEENISLTRPPSDYQSNLIINEAIALNLSGNRSDLDKLRERYGDVMAQSEKAKIFDLVTRPRQLGMLADKDSVGSLISEVDLFGDFLENYRKAN